MNNILLDTDSYKASHYLQYPETVTHVSSYIEARKSECLFFGLQAWIQKNLSEPICGSDIDEAEATITKHGLGFNRAGWEIIREEHDGFLPVEIRALKEGTIVDPMTPMLEIRNTDPRLPWLTSYLETSLLRAIWYPSTVAYNSWEIKQIIRNALIETTGSEDGLEFKLHDFGSRGVSSQESAGIGGAAHLVNFKGTDTLEAIEFLKEYYYQYEMPGFSIPAAEHSTITAWGPDYEFAAYRNMLDKFPDGLVAVVSDSYDIYKATEVCWGSLLRQQVLDRNGTVVIRPDSGDPLVVLPALLDILNKRFGATINSQGYLELPPQVRLIWGDGIDKHSIKDILLGMKLRNWAASNIAFGMGGALLQQVNRDTCGFAMKASAVCDQNGWRGIYKDPVTGSGKKSKSGIQNEGMSLVYRSQHGVRFWAPETFDSIRHRANIQRF